MCALKLCSVCPEIQKSIIDGWNWCCALKSPFAAFLTQQSYSVYVLWDDNFFFQVLAFFNILTEISTLFLLSRYLVLVSLQVGVFWTLESPWTFLWGVKKSFKGRDFWEIALCNSKQSFIRITEHKYYLRTFEWWLLLQAVPVFSH